MGEPMWMAGDPATFAETFDDVYEVDCGMDCGWTGEVPCTKEYKHGVMYVWGEYVCPNCNEKNSFETEYEDDGYDG